jgi:cbb3-type cytochrome oxidase maturation protein
MEAGVILLILGLGLLGGSAVLACSWAARDGQFEDLESAARVIFDAEELAEYDAAAENSRGGHGGGEELPGGRL